MTGHSRLGEQVDQPSESWRGGLLLARVETGGGIDTSGQCGGSGELGRREDNLLYLIFILPNA